MQKYVLMPCLKRKKPTDWSISSIIHNAFDLTLSFVSCEFCWVRRSLNSAAHLAAKYVFAFKVGLSCNNCKLPLILEACRQDCCTDFFSV